jgi:exodeoxyribonuclease VII small subunit
MGKSRRSAEGNKRGRDGTAEEQPDSVSAPASFETTLEQLEATVARLEEGEMPLEEALELFESGVKLSRQCSVTLEEAERRIEILVADRSAGEGSEAVPFESEEDSDGQQDDEARDELDDEGFEG